jgi:superfamily II DNA/RNA helicase
LGRVNESNNGFGPIRHPKAAQTTRDVPFIRCTRRATAAPGPYSRTESDPLNSFQGFGLAEPIARALVDEQYVTPTPIQAQTVPLALAGRDVIGIAQTGTGKTAAFALPILNRLFTDRKPPVRKSCRVLVLSPTRELSGQILDSFRAYGRHMQISSDLAIGGVSMGRQVRAMLTGLDVLVATPGRLLDLVHSNALKLDKVDVLVLDEADRMLDMGFIHDIRKIVSKLPKDRQTLFFSATMPQAIAELASQMLRDPARVAVTPSASTVDRIDQRIVHLDKAAKPSMLAEILKSETLDRCLVFTRTKHGADKVVRGLAKSGIDAEAIHGNKSQNQRERVLAAFRTGEVRILVATDIAARGIDVEGISHVVNYDLPNIPESYVHRIGRTARAGADGIAISFCDAEEMPFLRDIEKLIRRAIPSTDRRTGGHGRPAPAGHKTPAGRPAPRQAEPRRDGERNRKPADRNRKPDRNRNQDRTQDRNRSRNPERSRAEGNRPAAPQVLQPRSDQPSHRAERHAAPVRVGVPLAERPVTRSGPAVETALDQVAFLRRTVPAGRHDEQRVER